METPPADIRGESSDDANDTTERKTELNALLPVDRLPPELLGEIFLTCASLWREDNRHFVFSATGYHWWIALSHVCRWWHEITLAFAGFWSDFAVTSAELTEAMLSRSQQTPLEVKIYRSDTGVELIQRVLDHLQRIHTLVFSAGPLEAHSYVVGNSAPLLRSFFYILRPLDYFDDEELIDESDRRPASTSLDHVDMPLLNVLHLNNSGLPWSSPLLKPTLTELVFQEVRPGMAHANSRLSEILCVLRSMPSLTDLYLCGVLPPAHADDASALPDPFPLLHLSTMVVDSPTSSAACLLEQILYPPTAHIYIHCGDRDEHALAHLFRTLSAKTTRAIAVPPAQPAAVYLGDAMLCTWAGDPGAHVLAAASGDDVKPPPLLTMQHANTPLNAFLRHLDAAAPLTGITTLYFEPPWRGAVATPRWAAAAAGMANVRTLGVGRRGLGMLCALFADDVYGGAEGGAPVFPRLEVLLLRCVWMRRQPGAPCSSVLRALCSALRARSRAGYRLRRIGLVSCINVVPEDLELLRRWADEVDWDDKRYLAAKGARDLRRSDLGDGFEDRDIHLVRRDAGGWDSSGDDSDEDSEVDEADEGEYSDEDENEDSDNDSVV